MNASAPAAAAGVASAAPAPGAAPATMPAPAVPRCDNCGASVPGRYCGSCGQRLEPPVHSLWHFTRVAAEDLTHADSRLWRTLGALLFKPGFLTREFFAGRRASYLPPVRLYLVVSVVFFLWLSATGHSGMPDSDREARAAIAGASPGAVQEHQSTAASSKSVFAGDTQHCELIKYQGPWKATIGPILYRGCVASAQDHGRSLARAFLHNLPRAMFLFLPLLAGVMMLLYWHPRHYYVEHLLFCLHNHAFAFLVLLLAGVAGALVPFAAPLVGWLTTCYVIWYLFRSMRVMYGQSRLRTFGKLAFMSCVYLVAGSLMLAATALYAFVTL